MPSESNILFAESLNMFVFIFMRNYKENLPSEVADKFPFFELMNL